MISRKTQSRPWIKVCVILVASLLMAIALVAAWAYFRSQEVPEFYQRANARTAGNDTQQTQRPPGSASSGGVASPRTGSEQKLNVLLATLTDGGANAALDEWLAGLGDRSATRLQETFGEDDVNAWLERELPRRFQDSLPPGVSEPRVQFGDGKGIVGFRYQHGGLEGVVSLEVDVAMTGQSGQLGIRVRSISVGSLPLPVGQVLNLISDAGRRSQDPRYKGPSVIRWTQQGGDHMALLQCSGPGGGYFNELESFTLRGGEVEVAIKRRPIRRR